VATRAVRKRHNVTLYADFPSCSSCMLFCPGLCLITHTVIQANVLPLIWLQSSCILTFYLYFNISIYILIFPWFVYDLCVVACVRGWGARTYKRLEFWQLLLQKCNAFSLVRWKGSGNSPIFHCLKLSTVSSWTWCDRGHSACLWRIAVRVRVPACVRAGASAFP
jgi:hypothetical protein